MGIWGGGEDDLSILLFVMDRDFRAIRPARHTGHAAQKTPSLQQAGFLMACAEKNESVQKSWIVTRIMQDPRVLAISTEGTAPMQHTSQPSCRTLMGGLQIERVCTKYRLGAVGL
jgi:hypothetical protein